MAQQVFIRKVAEDEIADVQALVSVVFDEFVAPLYSDRGITEFKSFIAPSKLVERVRTNSFILVAEIGGGMVGMIAVRDYNHISLLFVRGDYQGRGIAKRLLAEAVQCCKTVRPELTEVTVNSSPNAVNAYRCLGFNPTCEEQLTNGIRYIPMSLPLSR